MRMKKRFKKQAEYNLELSSQSFTDIQRTNETSLSNSWFYNMRQNYWIVIGKDRGHFFLIFVIAPGKIIENDWLKIA